MTHPPIIGSEEDRARGALIESLAERYVGVRWIPGGHNIHGVDCIGLVTAVVLDLGLYDRNQIEIPRYNQLPNGQQMLKVMSKYLRRISKPQFGCVVTFSQIGTNLYHVGVVGLNYFYHAALDAGMVTKTTLTDRVLKDRKVCFAFERPESELELELDNVRQVVN